MGEATLGIPYYEQRLIGDDGIALGDSERIPAAPDSVSVGIVALQLVKVVPPWCLWVVTCAQIYATHVHDLPAVLYNELERNDFRKYCGAQSVLQETNYFKWCASAPTAGVAVAALRSVEIWISSVAKHVQWVVVHWEVGRCNLSFWNMQHFSNFQAFLTWRLCTAYFAAWTQHAQLQQLFLLQPHILSVISMFVELLQNFFMRRNTCPNYLMREMWHGCYARAWHSRWQSTGV